MSQGTKTKSTLTNIPNGKLPIDLKSPFYITGLGVDVPQEGLSFDDWNAQNAKQLTLSNGITIPASSIISRLISNGTIRPVVDNEGNSFIIDPSTNKVYSQLDYDLLPDYTYETTTEEVAPDPIEIADEETLNNILRKRNVTAEGEKQITYKDVNEQLKRLKDDNIAFDEQGNKIPLQLQSTDSAGRLLKNAIYHNVNDGSEWSSITVPPRFLQALRNDPEDPEALARLNGLPQYIIDRLMKGYNLSQDYLNKQAEWQAYYKDVYQGNYRTAINTPEGKRLYNAAAAARVTRDLAMLSGEAIDSSAGQRFFVPKSVADSLLDNRIFQAGVGAANWDLSRDANGLVFDEELGRLKVNNDADTDGNGNLLLDEYGNPVIEYEDPLDRPFEVPVQNGTQVSYEILPGSPNYKRGLAKVTIQHPSGQVGPDGKPIMSGRSESRVVPLLGSRGQKFWRQFTDAEGHWLPGVGLNVISDDKMTAAVRNQWLNAIRTGDYSELASAFGYKSLPSINPNTVQGAVNAASIFGNDKLTRDALNMNSEYYTDPEAWTAKNDALNKQLKDIAAAQGLSLDDTKRAYTEYLQRKGYENFMREKALKDSQDPEKQRAMIRHILWQDNRDALKEFNSKKNKYLMSEFLANNSDLTNAEFPILTVRDKNDRTRRVSGKVFFDDFMKGQTDKTAGEQAFRDQFPPMSLEDIKELAAQSAVVDRFFNGYANKGGKLDLENHLIDLDALGELYNKYNVPVRISPDRAGVKKLKEAARSRQQETNTRANRAQTADYASDVGNSPAWQNIKMHTPSTSKVTAEDREHKKVASFGKKENKDFEKGAQHAPIPKKEEEQPKPKEQPKVEIPEDVAIAYEKGRSAYVPKSTFSNILSAFQNVDGANTGYGSEGNDKIL